MSGEKSSRSVARFPSVHTPSLAIRMIPQKLLVPKEQEPSPILSKNPRKEVFTQFAPTNTAYLMLHPQRSDLSLKLITPKASVHRFAVVRVRVRRRVLSALDLIVRRGAAPPPRRQPKQPDKPDPEKPRILLQDPVLANHRSWVLPCMYLWY